MFEDDPSSPVEVALAAALTLPRPRMHVVAVSPRAPVVEARDSLTHRLAGAAPLTPDPSLEGVEDADARALASAAAGDQLWTLVAELAHEASGELLDPDPEGCDPTDAVLLEGIAAAERLAGGAAALQARLVAALDARWRASPPLWPLATRTPSGTATPGSSPTPTSAHGCT